MSIQASIRGLRIERHPHNIDNTFLVRVDVTEDAAREAIARIVEPGAFLGVDYFEESDGAIFSAYGWPRNSNILVGASSSDSSSTGWEIAVEVYADDALDGTYRARGITLDNRLQAASAIRRLVAA